MLLEHLLKKRISYPYLNLSEFSLCKTELKSGECITSMHNCRNEHFLISIQSLTFLLKNTYYYIVPKSAKRFWHIKMQSIFSAGPCPCTRPCLCAQWKICLHLRKLMAPALFFLFPRENFLKYLLFPPFSVFCP